MGRRRPDTGETERTRNQTIEPHHFFFLFPEFSPLSSVSIRVILFATIRQKYNIRELIVNCDGTIRDLIEKVSKSLGESFFDEVYDKDNKKVRDDIIFIINGRNIKDLSSGSETPLKDNDVVSIFPAIAGG